MEELKPCPFCGGKGRVSFRFKKYTTKELETRKIVYFYQVICNSCKARGPVITGTEESISSMRHYLDNARTAKTAWNRRAEQ